jgi:hypothetical protein
VRWYSSSSSPPSSRSRCPRHGAHVGEGEQEEVVQVLEIVAAAREVGDQAVVVQVPAEGVLHHHEVVLHEESHALGLLLGHPHPRANLVGVRLAAQVVILPVPLPHVVQQTGKVQHVPILEPLEERVLQREAPAALLPEFRQLVDRHEAVHVHRVHVEGVALHLADHPPELRDETSQHARIVHRWSVRRTSFG